MAVTGVGALLGSILAPRVIRRWPGKSLIAASTTLAGLVSFLLLWVDTPLEAGAVWGVVLGLGWLNTIAYFTLRQAEMPSHLLGRAVAYARMFVFAVIPISALLGAWIMQNWGIIPVILLCAGLRVLAGLWALRGVRSVQARTAET